jgi:cytochrome P450
MAKLGRADRFDVVEDLAIPVPMLVIAEMIGVETERRADFKAWSNAIVSGVSSSDKKRARLAGNETTTNLIGNAIVALLRNPDQLERAVAEPELVPNLVEETVRWDGPVQFIARRTTCDVELAETTIPADSRVILLLGSANRDERHFENPDEFDLSRETKGHVGFGLGIHFCLGASLARLEARSALAALIPELPRMRWPVGELAMVDSVLVRGRRRILLEPVA